MSVSYQSPTEMFHHGAFFPSPTAMAPRGGGAQVMQRHNDDLRVFIIVVLGFAAAATDVSPPLANRRLCEGRGEEGSVVGTAEGNGNGKAQAK
ncbi:hypothetical protein E2C01_094983 [Portunus trituberculatus]|uniref:Uncharacterized protein n=1 Tax=Portunus trituberculatus TaxID=210409 RepID=A0A5B7JNM2_PORTR|nr:hypothetical protein [Portunus trituberculatus]